MAITLSTANKMLRDGLAKAFRAEYENVPSPGADDPERCYPINASDITLELANGEPPNLVVRLKPNDFHPDYIGKITVPLGYKISPYYFVK